MAIELVNIDDRLIHGQVATSWTKGFNIESIIIVNDLAAADPIQKKIAGLAVPGVQVQIFGVEKFLEILKTHTINKRTMLLFANPIDLHEVLKENKVTDVVNISGMRFEKERKRLHKNVSVTEEEEKAIRNIIAMGVEVSAQTTLRDDRTKLSDLL